MQVCQANLDRMVNDSETLRQFIQNSEKEFGLPQLDLSKMHDCALKEYVEFLDDLWQK